MTSAGTEDLVENGDAEGEALVWGTGNGVSPIFPFSLTYRE